MTDQNTDYNYVIGFTKYIIRNIVMPNIDLEI